MHDRLDEVRRQPNALTALRLLLAASVLVGHCWPLGGFGGAPALGTEDLGTFAVACFFAISGYLVTGSRLSLPLLRFAWHRALRIYPAFWACLLVVAVLLAPATTVLTGHGFDVGSAASFVTANCSTQIGQWGISGTLSGVPFSPAGVAPWNGSLWTLYYEVLCYILVGLWFSVPSRRWARSSSWVVLLALTLASICHLHTPLQPLLVLGTYFAAGAALRTVDHVIPLDWRPAAVAAVSTVVITAIADPVLAALPLAYAVLWVSSRAPVWCRGWRQDYSYGVYIYAFPLQQVAALLGVQRFGLPVFLGVSAAATAPLAALSWRCVEAPVLRYRHAVPRLVIPSSRGGVSTRSAQQKAMP